MNKQNAVSTGLAGIAGGGVVALVIGVLGVGSTTTTVYDSGGNSSTGAVPAADGGTPLSAREIYKRDAPGVVFISSTIVQQTSDQFGFGGRQSGQATGSGFVIDKKGLILTNYHVVNGATAIRVGFDDKKTAPATLVGKDPSTDLALLKVDTAGLNLHPLTLGSSSAVQVGDPVLAIGNPFNLDRTLTTGVVSALQRRIAAPNGFQISDVIQTDAAINPGNSGGPLLNTAGEVIGVNSQIETGGSGSSGNVGIGFAVPINTAKTILPALSQGRRVERGWLGVEATTVDASLASLRLSSTYGALVQRVVPKSPAAAAGMRGGSRQRSAGGQQVLVGGDIIIAAGGHEIRTSDDLSTVIAGDKPGTKVPMKIRRGKDTITLNVTLGVRPAKL
jgi:S1-C subfamily serine protease